MSEPRPEAEFATIIMDGLAEGVDLRKRLLVLLDQAGLPPRVTIMNILAVAAAAGKDLDINESAFMTMVQVLYRTVHLGPKDKPS